LWGLQRTGQVANPKVALRVAAYLVPIYFAISGGKPLLWVCGSAAVSFYERVFGRNYDFAVLRGSARPDNPYPPLRMNHETGGSDDEHVVRLAEKRD